MADRTRVAEVCAAVEQDLDGLIERIVEVIRDAVPAYSVVAYQDQYDFIHAEFGIMLDCLARGTALPEHLVEASRELGKRRAQQGMTFQDVVQGYHLGLKAFWITLVEVGGDAGPTILEAASNLWDHVHVLTSAMAEGHGEATLSARAIRAGLRYRFLEVLTRWPEASSPEWEDLAVDLGYDPAGEFTAVVTPTHGVSEVDVESVQSVLERTGSGRAVTAHCSRVGDLLVVLIQGGPAGGIEKSLRTRLTAVPVGTGMTRTTLAGAAASIEDARLAVRLAGRGEIVHFEKAWPGALLAAHPEQRAHLIADGLDMVRTQPHLSEAVIAFAENAFSVSGAARALHLHANSVAYRLERWHELTGWDPRTYDGLVRSVTTLLLGAPPPPRLGG